MGLIDSLQDAWQTLWKKKKRSVKRKQTATRKRNIKTGSRTKKRPLKKTNSTKKRGAAAKKKEDGKKTRVRTRTSSSQATTKKKSTKKAQPKASANKTKAKKKEAKTVSARGRVKGKSLQEKVSQKKKAVPKKKVPKKKVPKKKIPHKKKSQNATGAIPGKRGSRKKQEKKIGKKVGQVTHYFGKIKVCVVRVDGSGIKSGDDVLVKGKKTDFSQKVISMQVESVDVKSAKRGQLVGLKVKKVVSVGDQVFLASN